MWFLAYIPWAFLRRAVTHSLLTYYGYLLPVFSSAKAIVQQDEESLQEWTTYWLVFSLFTILETVADVLISHWVLYLEFKLLIFIWLSHPRFQGAYRVHNLLLVPYFNRYETDIDKQLDEAKKQATATFNKTFRAIFISLFIDSHENFLATALRKMTSSAEEDIRDLQDVVHGKLEHKRSRTGSIALSRNLVKDFADLLRTGLYINIGLDRSETSTVFAQLDNAQTQLTFDNDADYPIPDGVPSRIALWRISTVNGGTDDDTCIALDIEQDDDLLTLYIQVPEEEDAGVLAMGIQLLVVSVKNKVKKGLRKLCRFTEFTQLHSSLGVWRALLDEPRPNHGAAIMTAEDEDAFHAAQYEANYDFHDGDDDNNEHVIFGDNDEDGEDNDDDDDVVVEPRLSNVSIQRLSFVLRHGDGESTEYESSEYDANSNGGRSSGRYVSMRSRQHTSYVPSDYSSDAEHSDTFSDSAHRYQRSHNRSPVIEEELQSPFDMLEEFDEPPLTADDSDADVASVHT